jgi:hypothetical protein
MKLWPKAKERSIRFHDLRHTTASLLMMAGANPAAVQRILRHSDPRITTEVYGHLAPGYLRDEVDRLRFFPAEASAPVVQEIAPVVQEAVSFGPPVVQASENAASEPSSAIANQPKTLRKTSARHRRFELLTYGSGARAQASGGLFFAVGVASVTGTVPGAGDQKARRDGSCLAS